MKKTLFFGLIAAALGFTACSSEDDAILGNNTQKKGMVLNATVEQPAETRATIDNSTANWQFAFAQDDVIKVTNSAVSGTYYTFTSNGTTFSSSDAETTATAADWFAYFPSNSIDLTNQDGTMASVANLYALAGTTASATTGADGLTIPMSAKVAILKIVNIKGTINIQVKTSASDYVTGLTAKNGEAGFDVSTSTTATSLFTTSTTGIYYVAVPAGVQLAIKDGNTVLKSTIAAGLTAGKYYNLEIAPEYVEIGGKKWATKNLGATTVAGSLATCAGDYYQWGSVNKLYESISWSGTTASFINLASGGFNADNREIKDSDVPAELPAANDVVTQTLGNGWRMPTKDDFEALHNACTSSIFVTELSSSNPGAGVYKLSADQPYLSEYSGVAGILYVATADTSKRVFFPAASYVDGTSLSDGVTGGRYWSSSLYTGRSDLAYYLAFNPSLVLPSSTYSRYCGFTVRPVSD